MACYVETQVDNFTMNKMMALADERRQGEVDFESFCLFVLGAPRNLISQKVFIMSFFTSQFLHKSVNLSFILTNSNN